MASFVDVSDLTKSSPLGRIMSEQVGSRLAQKGYRVIEMKLRQNSIFVDPENKGEFLLSRNIKDISNLHQASIVVVGTYAKGNDTVYVSARMVNPIDSVIMSSCDYELDFPNHRELMSLMAK
ncbi:FlgO family outer membrane protein [uncultured Desulfobacter sp.]|uniref:FlgO family outer membrane protein n=1 Tax=uncultured Desulfobacter sp. TaxID=240139 RepID=UPI002AABE67F|nr:FlgO family outer membrane protein [uncultured Desulfobacter sp.]